MEDQSVICYSFIQAVLVALFKFLHFGDNQSDNFIMQNQADQVSFQRGQKPFQPFDIVHNVRSSKASRSRKSSVHTLDKEKPKLKTKKLRKMTMNPEIFHPKQLQQIAQLHEQKGARSEKGEQQEQDVDIDNFLQIGGLMKAQSKQQQLLQKGILFGITSERELDSDFYLSSSQINPLMDLQLQQ